MSKKKKENPLRQTQISNPKDLESDPRPLTDESHGVTLNRPFGVTDAAERIDLERNIEFHLTIQLKMHLSPRQLSLLLDVLNYQAVRFGMNFNMVLAMWELYFRLLGNKKSAAYVSEGKIKVTLTVTEILLRTMKHESISLSPGDFYHIPKSVKDLLRPGLMSHRTYGSRFKTWRPEKYLHVRIVPVEVQFIEHSQDSQPYISYCKGYGESHPSAHRQKTKISPELDSDVVRIDQDEEMKLLVESVHPQHLLAELLINTFRSLIEKN